MARDNQAVPPEAEAYSVMVVEDDPIQRRLICLLLRSWGYSTLEAWDGEMALRMLRDRGVCVSVLILDIMMPILDGIEVARQLQFDRPGLPIIACSAILHGPVEAQLLEFGVQTFLHKPYTSQSLHDIVLQACSMATSRPGARLGRAATQDESTRAG